VPVITTDVPLPAAVGKKEVIVGADSDAETKVKLEVELVAPLGVVTPTTPLEPLPTIAVIWVAEFTVKLCAAVPPKLTAVAPIKLVPVITTEVPLPQEVGEKELIIGTEEDAEPNVKLDEELADPPGVVTLIAPLDPPPTLAVICVAEFIIKLWAAVPPKLTAVAPTRLVPVITTDVSLIPEAGEKELIVGIEFEVVVEVVVVEVLVVVNVPIPTCPPVTVTPGIVLALTSEIITDAGVMLAQLLTLDLAVKFRIARVPIPFGPSVPALVIAQPGIVATPLVLSMLTEPPAIVPPPLAVA